MECTTASNCPVEKEYQFPTVSLLNPKNQTQPGRDEFRKLVESSAFSEKRIPIIIGTDEEGNAVIDDLVSMKHLLVISAAFGIPSFYDGAILGIFYKCKPGDVKLLLVDPQFMEFGVYNGVPHMLAPVIFDSYAALGVLDWALAENAKRCQVFINHSVDNIEDYRRLKTKDCLSMPHIIILINQLRYLYRDTSKKKVDTLIDLLIRDGAKTGIHLIIASEFLTPNEFCTEFVWESVNPRLVFCAKTQQDSEMALGMAGAERLPDAGRAFYRDCNLNQPRLVHFPDYWDAESARNDVERVVNYLRSNNSCDMTDNLMLEFKSRGQVIKAEIDDEHMETVCKQLNEAAEFFQNVLTNSFHNGQPIDREIFSRFCGYVKLTYQAFYEETAKEVLIGAMPSFRTLAQLSEADNRYCNFECEIIRRFSSMTTCAIEEIGGDFTRENRIFTLVYPTLKYNYDEDTPEAVYNCIKSALIEERGSGECQNCYKDDSNIFVVKGCGTIWTGLYDRQGLKMKIKICSREAAERLLQGHFPDNTAVISFYNPHYGGADTYTPVDYTGKAKRIFQIALDSFQSDMPEAAELAKFIDRAASDRMNIICQCDSGHSRSAGCAAAILEHYCHTGQTVFDSGRYRPDEMVYYSVLNALDNCQ